MGKEGENNNKLAEEGEISDSGSIEEITEEVFVSANNNNNSNNKSQSANKPESKPNKNVDRSKPRQQQVWTMEDLVKYQNKYQMSRNYAPGLYNFAWAQAVQNKPLDDYLTNMNNNNANKEVNVVVDDDDDDNDKIVVMDLSGDGSEKEEGEIEEGEIDLDIDTDVDMNNKSKQEEEGSNDVEKLIDVIRIGLQGITLNDANKSFDGVCTRLEELIESLKTLLSENSVSNKDDLVQLAYCAVQLVYSVFSSMGQNEKEQSRDVISRFLTKVKSCAPAIFSTEHLKEVEIMFQSCNLNFVSSSSKDNEEDRDVIVTQEPTSLSQEVISSTEKPVLDSTPFETFDQNPKKFEALKVQTSNPKNRAVLPLLDLHKDHDMDSLPSPTRETSNVLPLGRGLFGEDASIRPEWPTPRAVVRRYDTDALKAVSTYQQKFGGHSFFSSDLPSPTPSEGSDGDVGGDCGGEVSSFSTAQNLSCVTEATSDKTNSFSISDVESPNVQFFATAVSSVPMNSTSTSEKRDFFGNTDPERPNVQIYATARSSAPVSSSSASEKRNPSGNERPNLQLFANPRSAAPVYSTSSSVTRVSNKTRDPRLRLAKSDNSLDTNHGNLQTSSKQPAIEPLDRSSGVRKQKTFDEPVLVDGPAPKRLKNNLAESVGPSNVGTISQTRGLESAVTTSGLPTTTSVSMHIPATAVNATSASLQSFLKDLVVNPAQLMNLISMEQHKSVDPVKYVTQSPNQTSVLGSMPMTSSASQPLVVGQRSTAEIPIPQTASADDFGKVRMKPRDPRRALHSKSLQKPEPINSSFTAEGTKGNLKKADPRVLSQPISAPDITQQFTKNLKNIADLVSTTVSTSVQPSSQPAQVHSSFVNMKAPPSQSAAFQNEAGETSEQAASGTTQSQNNWENVEQYFGKFDDQQRAAIQRERSKRMEEQKKMFADRKLCLVLDLDHTLLNSAKYSEIEPGHIEMLKKKEEQDRDKPYRHLFKFPHMCMWTKLRPGIWNFLEKASKLFELHLYTMGNKLYATEMAKVLDPKGVLFNGRVISRGDDGDNVDGDPKSKDLEGVLGMESSVVIIDDSIRVWPHNKLNLIVVERYIYFPCSRRQFGLPGPSLLEIDHDERPEDGTLASSLAVIEKIHRNFFSEKSLDDADVRNILASEQRKILGGCRIVFSRVFPVGDASPHLHPLWQTAEQFGAVCTNQIDEQVTHVVANSLGTDKVNWALATGRPVVHPGWVEASALLYRRANEHDFAVKP
uniref:RNA polymerase II C-terminal domain phosphatase-like 3 n=1 Tax=Erigeron canadensis TaxID=72917 RepID=UPI001CB9B9FF|nr:RNA polymerase II C-terminal domain phosphatase-like 3 [Erigeron canadensis]